MRISILLLLIIALSACHSFKVIPVKSDTRLKQDGVFYYLPETRLIVDVAVKEIHYLKGPFAQYSAKFTGISNVITENKTEYSIENITLNSYSVPDTSKLFYICTGRMKDKDEFLLQLDEQGIITGLNSTLSDAVSVSGGNSNENVENEGNSVNANFEYFATSNTQIKTDTIVEKIILDTVTIEKQILQHSIIEKSMEDKAKDAADYISLISENKMNLIAGYQEVAYDLNTFNTMLVELNKMLEDYLNLFTGKSIEYTRHYRFVIDPRDNNRDKVKFTFCFDPGSGILETPVDSAFEGTGYYYEIIPEADALAISKVISTQKKFPNNGLAYNIPEACTFFIKKESGDVVFSEKVLISQLGTVGYMPAKMRHISYKKADGSVNKIEK